MQMELIILIAIFAAFALTFLWLLSRGLRMSLAYTRTLNCVPVTLAAEWWLTELRGAETPPPGGEESILSFAVSLRCSLANARALGSESYYEDIGPQCATSGFLQRACLEANIDLHKSFSPALRMRIRDHRVSVSRSGGVFWENIWAKH